MQKLFIILAILFCSSFGFAKKFIEFGQQGHQNITDKLQVFRSQKGFEEISDVLFLDHLFTINNNRLLEVSADDNVVWTKFDIRNTNQYPIAIFIEYRNANIQQIQFYVKRGHLLIHKKQSGTKLPFTQRSIKNRFFVKRIVLEPGINYTIFTKIKNFNDGAKIPINLYDQQEFNQRTSTENLQAGLIYGIFFSLLISSLLFLILKFHIKSQIYFMFYMLSFIVYFFMMDGFGFQFFLNDKPFITSYIIKILPFLIIAAFGVLSLNFLKENNIKGVSTQIIIGIIISALTLLALTLLIKLKLNTTIVFSILLSLILIFIIIYSDIRYLKQQPNNKFFVWALFISVTLPLLLGLQFYLSNFNYNDFHIIIKITVIFQFGLISLSFYKSLQIKHSAQQQENIKKLEALNKVIEGQKQNLEYKVEERTHSLQVKNAELEEHIAENKAITEELHKQRDEMKKLNDELKQAFKKSTADHVRLQKALYQNEQQQEKIQQSFDEIKEKNRKLEIQNEEILSQRDKIQEQHHLLEIKNRDIIDSIKYAERIQHSILPPQEIFSTIFKESFIYFKPKEQLSGDFYWFESVQQNGMDYHIVSAIDCTGHGVPGALMSIIAKDGLNEAVNSKKLIHPTEILNHLNNVTIKTLNKENNTNNVKDGMDLSLITINPQQKKIYFAGARNPLYLFRNNKLQEFTSSIFSVGTLQKVDVKVKFKTQEIPYQENDMVYLFSDGFADQFGGEKGNKFRYKRFKKLLETVENMPIDNQKERIASIFEKWKGNWEQIDDILIIGIRL